MSLGNKRPKPDRQLGIVHIVKTEVPKFYVWTGIRHYELNNNIVEYLKSQSCENEVVNGSIVVFEMRNGDSIHRCTFIEQERNFLTRYLPFLSNKDKILKSIYDCSFYKQFLYNHYFEHVFDFKSLNEFAGNLKYLCRTLNFSKTGEESEDGHVTFEIVFHDLPIMFRNDPYLHGFVQTFKSKNFRSGSLDTGRLSREAALKKVVAPNRRPYDTRAEELTVWARGYFLSNYDRGKHEGQIKQIIEEEAKKEGWGSYGYSTNYFNWYLDWRPQFRDYTNNYKEIIKGSPIPRDPNGFIQTVEMSVLDIE